MQNKLVGKCAIVTGASSGIGKSVAKLFANHGANLMLSGRDIKRLEQTAEECRAFNVKVAILPGDVAVENYCRQLIEKTVESFGRIDILVNNAGISMRALFGEMNLDVLRKVMDVNFYGTVQCTKFALPYLLASKGSMVAVSSIAGYRGLPARTGYSASKFAVNGFCEVLRTEYMHQGLHVLNISPGYTASNIRNTALTSDGSSQGESPLKEDKLMHPGEVALYMLQGILKRKKVMVLTTQGKVTVLLNKIFPSFMDKVVYNFVKKEPDSPF